MRRCALVTLLAVVYMTSFRPVEGTWGFRGWFEDPVPDLRRPDSCNPKILLAKANDGEIPIRDVWLVAPDGTVAARGESLESDENPDAWLVTPNGTVTIPEHYVNESVEGRPTLDDAIPVGSPLPDHPWPFLVRIGRTHTVAGVLISNRHVLTLSDCIYPLMSKGAPLIVKIYDTTIKVIAVDTHPEGREVPFAVLTLAEHTETRAIPVCLGLYREGFPTQAVSWENSEDSWYPVRYPVVVYPFINCGVLRLPNTHNLCASQGPNQCGSALLQEDSGYWTVVGLATAASTRFTNNVVRYLSVTEAQLWLEI